MNLEITAEEEFLIAQANLMFEGLTPVSRLRSEGLTSTWRTLVEAGWADIGASIEDSTLDISAAAGVFRAAGRHLVVEQIVTSGYVLSALTTHLEVAERKLFSDRLSCYPGILCGEGRALGLPIDNGTRALCFGIDEPFDLYRLTLGDQGELRFGFADPSERHEAHRVAHLAVGVGYVAPPPVPWHDATLFLSSTELARIEFNAILLHSAALVGAAEALLELTRDYTINRVQFGVPVGSFQAVKHGLADVLVSVEVAWSALLCAVADGATDRRRVLVARILAVEAALAAARSGAQYHGGIGFTWESDLHWYLKVLIAGAQRFGSPDDIAAILARSVEAI